MATQAPVIGTPDFRGLDEIRRHWGWFVGVGLALVVLGVIAGIYAIATTIATALVFGWLLIIGGVIEGMHAFGEKRWGGFFIDLFTGILYLVAGFVLVANPAVSAVALTLVVAMFLIVSGLFRAIAAIAIRAPHWAWVLLHGAIAIVLGVCIWQQWPVSGLWVIGLVIGIELILNGLTLVMLGSVARRIPVEAQT